MATDVVVQIPASHRDAYAELKRRGIAVYGDVAGIIRVNPESILYLQTEKQVMTAWIGREKVGVMVATEPGMPSERTVAAVPRGIKRSL